MQPWYLLLIISLQELEAQLESERSRLEKEKEDLAMEYGQVKADLSGRLKTAEEEVGIVEY